VINKLKFTAYIYTYKYYKGKFKGGNEK